MLSEAHQLKIKKKVANRICQFNVNERLIFTALYHRQSRSDRKTQGCCEEFLIAHEKLTPIRWSRFQRQRCSLTVSKTKLNIFLSEG